MTGETNIVSNKRRKFKISYILIFLFLIVIAAFISFKHNTKKELDKKIKAIRAAGYPVTLEELDEWYSIPDGYENGADIIRSASEYYLQDQNDLKVLPFVGSGEIKGRNEPLSEEVMSRSSQFLEKNKKCLDLLYTLKNYKYCRYPIDLNSGLDTLLSHINHIYSSMKLLQLDSVYHAEFDEPELVINSIEAFLCLARSLHLEPIVISQTSRLGVQKRSVETLEYVFNKANFNEEELSQLQGLLKESNKFSGMARGIIGERCITLYAFQNILSLDGESLGIELPPVFILEAYKALGIVDRESINYLDLQKEYLDVLMLPPHERPEASKVLEFKLKEIKKKSPLLKRFMYEPNMIVGIELRNIASLINARTTIAIERYRLKNNELPDSLSNLVPDFLESVPLDPFDGKQLRYKKLDKGFVVYSIGEDMKDDGGKEMSKNNSKSTYDITFIVEH